MRRILLFLPFVLVGCKPGRQATVSSTGAVASTVDGGTFVSGMGRVAEGGDDVAWSPDGSSLAISTEGGALVWPKGTRAPKMRGPLAWSPFGDRVAGVIAGRAGIWDLATGGIKATTLVESPQGLCWTPEGRLVGNLGRALQADGGPRLDLKNAMCADAVATADGGVAYLAWNGAPAKRSDLLTASLSLGRWNLATGETSTEVAGKVDDLFGAPSARWLIVPVRLALAPDGRRFAMAGLRIEAGARSLARLKELGNGTKLSPAEHKELDAIVKSSRFACVVVVAAPGGLRQTLWNVPSTSQEGGPTDLAWSPDGKWLAIARKDGTVRVAVE